MISIRVKKNLKGPTSRFVMDVNLHVQSGQIVALYGRSGSGKTTLLKTLAGLIDPDEGLISVDDVIWFNSESGHCLKPQKRQCGLIFQDYALFNNMSVRSNIEYALQDKSSGDYLNEIVEIMELEDLLDRSTHSLSGGEKQRVAIARSLVQKPDILLMDEALAAVDIDMKRKLQDLLLKIHRKYQLTTIFVSHDIGEIVRLADMVCVMESGAIKEIDDPLNIFASKQVSGKFQLIGEVINIQKEDILYVASILTANSIVKVVIDRNELADIEVGDKVIIASKAFNPVIQKISTKG